MNAPIKSFMVFFLCLQWISQERLAEGVNQGLAVCVLIVSSDETGLFVTCCSLLSAVAL